MKAVQVWMQFWNKVAELLLIIVTTPYYLLFLKNTKRPIFEVVRASGEEEVAQKIRKWLKAKRREAIYIQAAVSTYKISILSASNNSFLQGAVMFSTVTGALQWPDIDSRYWLGPACWYSSLVLAIAAVILAAQQTILLETLKSNDNLECYQEHFWGTTHPRWWLLFAWQAPFMLLNYSIFLFLIGLCSHIGNPFAFTR
jgi:hypothetical protein